MTSTIRTVSVLNRFKRIVMGAVLALGLVPALGAPAQARDNDPRPTRVVLQSALEGDGYKCVSGSTDAGVRFSICSKTGSPTYVCDRLGFCAPLPTARFVSRPKRAAGTGAVAERPSRRPSRVGMPREKADTGAVAERATRAERDHATGVTQGHHILAARPRPIGSCLAWAFGGAIAGAPGGGIGAIAGAVGGCVGALIDHYGWGRLLFGPPSHIGKYYRYGR